MSSVSFPITTANKRELNADPWCGSASTLNPSITHTSSHTCPEKLQCTSMTDYDSFCPRLSQNLQRNNPDPPDFSRRRWSSATLLLTSLLDSFVSLVSITAHQHFFLKMEPEQLSIPQKFSPTNLVNQSNQNVYLC